MGTNAAGNAISLGTHCRFPANMTRRNAFRAPGLYNINLGIYKNFQLTERYKLQFRSEFYNLLNHSNLYVQNGSSADAGNGPGPLQIIAKKGVNPSGGVPNGSPNSSGQGCARCSGNSVRDCLSG